MWTPDEQEEVEGLVHELKVRIDRDEGVAMTAVSEQVSRPPTTLLYPPRSDMLRRDAVDRL